MISATKKPCSIAFQRAWASPTTPPDELREEARALMRNLLNHDQLEAVKNLFHKQLRFDSLSAVPREDLPRVIMELKALPLVTLGKGGFTSLAPTQLTVAGVPMEGQICFAPRLTRHDLLVIA